MSKFVIVEGNSNDKDNVRTYMVKGEKGDKGDNGEITYSDVVDNLTSTETQKPLSANQGKTLKTLIDKKPYYYNNVSGMIADTTLQDGDMVITSGYYSVNDGGSSLYKITSTQPTKYYETLTNGLYAELIIENRTINFKQFGIVGDGETDESTLINTILNYAITNKLMVEIGEITTSTSINITDNIILNFEKINYTGNGSALVIKSENGCVISGNKLISSAKGLELNNVDVTTTNGSVEKFDINIQSIESESDAIWVNANASSKGIVNGTIKGKAVKSNNGKGIMVDPSAGWTGQIKFDITKISATNDYAIYLTTENGGSLKGFNFPYVSFEGSKYGLYWNFDTKACEPIFGYFRTAELAGNNTRFKFVGTTTNLTEVSRIKFDRAQPSSIDVSEITPTGHYNWGYIILEGAIRQSSNMISESIVYSNFLTYTKYPENAIYLSGSSDYEWSFGTKIATMVIPQNTNQFNIYIPKWMGVFSGEFQILIQDPTWKNIKILSPNGTELLDLSTITFSANDVIKFRIIDADQHEKIIWAIEKNSTYPKTFGRS